MFYEGQLFGFWKILDETPQYSTANRHLLYSCICTKCNKTKALIRKDRLLLSDRFNECVRCKRNFDDFIGYPTYQKKYFSHIKSHAKRRKIPFTIKISDIYKLLLKQEYKCKITGLDINITDVKNTASLDRIDSGKGYIKSNIQWVHIDINKAKGSLSMKEYIDQCKLVVEFNSKSNN
jgi:hypothetical protein